MPVGNLQRDRDGIDWFLVIGAALYWASMLYLVFDRVSSGASFSTSDEFIWARIPFVVLFAVLATVCSRAFEKSHVRRAVALLGIFAGIGAMVSLYISGESYGSFFVPLAAIHSFLSGISIVAPMLLWGFSFASLDKRTAGKNVALTALGTVLLSMIFLVLVSLDIGASGAVLKIGARIASLGILLVAPIRFVSTNRTLEQKATLPLLRFYGFRIMWGIAIGVLNVVVTSDEASVTLSVLVVGVVAVVIPLCLHAKDDLYGYLPILPLVLAGLLVLPFLSRGYQALSIAAPTILWLVWIALSSFQLSGLKETFGMSEARLCFSEKAVVSFGWLLGIYVASQLLTFIPADVMVIGCLYLVLLGSTYVSFRTVYNRKEDERIGQLVQTREEHTNLLYDEICARYGLTKREREVMEMLAQGYTRTFIRTALVISDGTARAHIAHVYQKLEIHKKDDLLKLVRSIDEGAQS